MKDIKDNIVSAFETQANVFKDVLNLQTRFVDEYVNLAVSQIKKVSDVKDANELIEANENFVNKLKDHNTKFFNEANKVAEKTASDVKQNFKEAGDFFTKETTQAVTNKTNKSK